MSASDIMKKYTNIVEGRGYSQNGDISGMSAEQARETRDELQQIKQQMDMALHDLSSLIRSNFPYSQSNLKAYLIDQIAVAVGGHGFATMNPTLEDLLEQLEEHIMSGGRDPDAEDDQYSDDPNVYRSN